jgi:ribonucleoside-triphosphate reductase
MHHIVKRDGRIVPFDQTKITTAIWKAMRAVGDPDEVASKRLSDLVAGLLNERFVDEYPTVEEIQDIVEETLIEAGYTRAAKAYIIYRKQHADLREMKGLLTEIPLVEDYLFDRDWRVRENSNMSYSLQGLNTHITDRVITRYWLNKVYPREIREPHERGDFHIHDLGTLGAYCVGWDLKDLLLCGFRGVRGKVESRPAKHFRVALLQVVNFMYTLQGESAGAQAFSNLDTYLAPFIRYDNLSYEEVKQNLQEFVYNMNVPTRVGFQCMSQDTEILGSDGWKRYDEVREGDSIATFNIEKGYIEYLPVKRLFAREYSGKMYHLKNRISDQLISPKHRVVRRKFYSDEYVLETIEDVVGLKSPFIVPIGSDGNVRGGASVDEDVIRLIAWIVAEGTLDASGRGSGRGSGRISIHQSRTESPDEYEEIVSICHSLGLEYTERTQEGLDKECNVLRFNANSTRKILGYFNSDKERGIKFIPDVILGLDAESSRLFLETYVRGDGYDSCKIITTSEAIKDGLLQVAVNAGYGATFRVRKPDNSLSKKDRYIIRLIRHKDTYIDRVEEVEYEGVIWCPNTDNETVIARRNGKVFITGNTPFTNITLDLEVPRYMKGEPVIIGGKLQDTVYGDYQHEMDLFNRAFAEVMLEGDMHERPFTFPIPTYNITEDFDWENENLKPVWEMTAKYGIPYFSNFIGSDMKPEDARSMCCRLRIDNRELRKRGGGLFGANPLTGSIGVVTINMPRLGYLAEDEDDFFDRLEKLMELAKESLVIKRKTLETLTENGLYPYSKFYLSEIKKSTGGYWTNHFSTIGLIGMNEALLNLYGLSIADEEGRTFALKTLDFMREQLSAFQEETGSIFNLEATPAEGASYRLAKKDLDRYPDIRIYNKERYGGETPYYTNSTHLPVGLTEDLFVALQLQDPLQTRYTGGTVFHAFLGERFPSPEATKRLVRKIAENFHLPYYTLTPTFSVCPKHGYIPGEHKYCPKCDEELAASYAQHKNGPTHQGGVKIELQRRQRW